MFTITTSYPLWMYEMKINYSYNMFVFIHEFLILIISSIFNYHYYDTNIFTYVPVKVQSSMWSLEPNTKYNILINITNADYRRQNHFDWCIIWKKNNSSNTAQNKLKLGKHELLQNPRMRPCVPYNWNHSRNQYDQTDKHNCFWLDIVCENFIILQTLNMLPFCFNPTYKMDEMGYNYIF